MSHDDLLIATLRARASRSQFESIERALPRQRLPAIGLFDPILTGAVGASTDQRLQGIVPQVIMIVEIDVPQRDVLRRLQQQFLNDEVDPLSNTVLRERSQKLPNEPQPLLDLPQSPSVRSNLPPIKLRHHLTASLRLKPQPLLETLSHHETTSRRCLKSCYTSHGSE